MSNMKRFAAVLVAATIGLSGFAIAHEGAEGMVKERMDMMGDIGKAMKRMGLMIKGEVDYDAEVAKAAALEIYGHATHIPEMFPEGSTEKPSEALPAIWENWDEFVAISEQMKTDAKQLAEIAGAANSADAIKVQFGAVGKSCGSCHEKFRLKQ
ncbi:MAG: cytochrome c [Pseudomonadota bacterium]